MQKLIGSILILTASAGIGVAKGMELQQYLKELELLKQLFLMLKSEIKYTRAPLGEAFADIGGRLGGMLGAWLISLSEQLKEKSGTTFSGLWTQSIMCSFRKSSLKESDVEQLKAMGGHMGYLDEEMQLGTIDLYLEQLELTICRVREELTAKRKLCHCLGVMGGIFLVVIFM